MNNGFIFTTLNGEGREAFDRIMFNGSLGTPATPYDEYVANTQPYKVGRHNQMTLQQVVDYILDESYTNGHILAVSSEDSVKSYNLAVYKEGKIVFGSLLLEIMSTEPAELLYKMQMQDNTVWVLKLNDVNEAMNNRGGISVTPSLYGL